MADSKHYSVMELAEKVGVPRTTINDWFVKYSSYIEFTMQGKRRVYSENTLSVLMKISRLRESGMSSFDIEKELAKTYAVQPSAVTESPASAEEKKTEEETPVPPAVTAESVILPALANYSMTVKQQNDELAEALGTRFQDILQKMDSIEEKSRKNAVRTWYFSALAFLLLVLLSAGGYFAWIYAQEQDAAAERREEKLVQLHEQSEAMRLDEAAMREQIQKLQESLPVQQKAFDKALEDMRRDADKRREADLAAAKDRFAAQQLAHAKELEQMQKNLDSIKNHLQSVQDAAKDKEAQIKKLEETVNQKDADLRKSKEDLETIRSLKVMEAINPVIFEKAR